MKTIVASCCFFVFTLGAYAQKENLSTKIDKILSVKYQPGYAVLVNGDTVSGDVQFNDTRQNFRELVIRDTETLKKTSYLPTDVKFFSLFNQDYIPYETTNEGWVFMRVVFNDAIKMYMHRVYTVQSGFSKVYNQFYIIKPDGSKLIILPNADFPFKSKVSEFFKDDQQLFAKINNDSYKRKDLQSIVTEYNEWFKKNLSIGK